MYQWYYQINNEAQFITLVLYQLTTNVFTSLVVFISQDSGKFNVKRKVGHFKKNGKLFPDGMVVTLSTQALYLFRQQWNLIEEIVFSKGNEKIQHFLNGSSNLNYFQKFEIKPFFSAFLQYRKREEEDLAQSFFAGPPKNIFVYIFLTKDTSNLL